MNFEKIRNYNQLLLAIAGTAGLLFFIIGGIFVLWEMAGRYTYNDPQSGIIATEETDQLMQDSLRKQIISFYQPEMLDSANQVYVLPVSQADLAKAEYASDPLGLINTYGDYYKEHPGRADENYNNLVLHYGKDNTSVLAFDFRISINAYYYEETPSGKYLIITGCTRDTNGDKYLNTDDIQELYCFNLETRALSKIQTAEKLTALGLYPVPKSTELVGRFGLDRDKNGEFEWIKEPVFFYRIDPENKKLIRMVSTDQLETLQRLLEGR